MVVDFIISFLAVLAYSVLSIFSLIGCAFYIYAYNKMKHTKVIGSLALLLLALTVDSFLWFTAEYYRFTHDIYPPLIISPIILLIVKGFLAFTVIMFVLTSIRREKIKLEEDDCGEQRHLF